MRQEFDSPYPHRGKASQPLGLHGESRSERGGARRVARFFNRKILVTDSPYPHKIILSASLAQLVEQLPLKEMVRGSNPSRGIWSEQANCLACVGFEKIFYVALQQKISALQGRIPSRGITYFIFALRWGPRFAYGELGNDI